jgi:polyisoprenoid-binding protein YceI
MNSRFWKSGMIALTAIVATGVVTGVMQGTAVQAIPQKAGQKVSPADLTGTWAIDNSHTEIGFAVAHLGVSKTRGRFTDFSGTLNVNGTQPEKSSVTVDINVNSINTGNEKRDEHLRGKDFFDAATYPKITFKSTSIRKAGSEYIAYGNLTLKSATKPVALRFKPTPAVKGPDGKLHAGMSTKLSINRKDYGLTWNGVIEGVQAVGDIVDITIDLEAIKQ